MTTYMIALAFLCLVYGLFWNNRPAREMTRRIDKPEVDRWT